MNGTYTSDSNGTGVIINAQNVTIESGAQISASGKGYAANAGTGKGSTSGAYGSGGSHGGRGAISAVSTVSGPIYGLATDPTSLGSGGGNGGAGGGAIFLNLSGGLIVNGSLYAKGINGGTNTGGGGGGSIKVFATDMSGAGSIDASGGAGGAGGGGGRIAIYHTGSFSVDKAKVLASAGKAGAGIGSVLVYDKTNKDCTIFSDITFDPNIGIDETGSPATNGIFNFRNLIVNNNAVLYNKIKYTTDSDGVGIELKLTGDLTVSSGSKIDGVGLGYPIGVGEGKPTGTGNNYGGGGAHGGVGGRGESGLGGSRYDSTLFPVKPGSGGYTSRGGVGGSAIKITAVDIVIDGSLDQSASGATINGATQGSGAGGGSVYIVSSTISGAGTIKADASNGTGNSGGGGGGRIAIYGDTSSFTAGNITANKGVRGGTLASADGVIGTVFLYDTATGNVSASNDVSFEANQGVNRDGTARTDGVFYFNNLTVTNNSTVTIGGYYTDDSDGRGVTLNLDGDLTIDSGSNITAAGQGYVGGTGQGKGSGTSSTSGSGGSYGGLGGRSYNNNLPLGVYGADNANYPSALGSGGGIGTGIGGKGGGAIALRVLGAIINNGGIVANGASGSGGFSSWKPGGGSGGSIFINCDSMSGSGTVTSKGGDGLGDANFGSGGGGGGRISVVYSSAQSLPLANFSTLGGVGGGSTARNGAEGSTNITQRVLPAAEFTLKNPNNNSTEFTNTENVEIVPTDENVEKYREAASSSELVPTFYADGWANVTDGKDIGVSEGEKTVRAWFKDGNELISSSVGSATITLDKTQPEIAIANNNQTTADPNITINLTLSDELSGIDYITVDGEKIEIDVLAVGNTENKASSIKAYADETTYQTDVDLVEGENTIEIVAYDNAGNSTSSNFIATRTVAEISPTPTPDATSPTPAVTSSSASSAVSSTTNSTNEAFNDASMNVFNEMNSIRSSVADLFTADADTQDTSSQAQENTSEQEPAKSHAVYLYIALGLIAIISTGILLVKLK